jgi:ketosteroid isomerase-like protein
MRSRWLVAFLWLGACAGAVKPAGPALPAATETPATADEVRAVTLDGYAQVAQGYDNVYLEGVARDARVLFMGVRPGDIVAGYDGPRIAAMHRLFGDDAVDLVSKDLEVHLSRDATCAWVADDLSYRSLRGQRRAFLPLRRTAVYERLEGRWLLIAEDVSYPAPDTMAARSATAVPGVIAGGSEGQAVRQRVVNVLSGADESPVSLDDAALTFGPHGERARGRDVGKVATPQAFFAAAAEVTGMRVGVSRSGTVAWASASFSIGAGGPAGRAMFVLEKRGGLWWIIQTHVSRPVTSETLAADLGIGGS